MSTPNLWAGLDIGGSKVAVVAVQVIPGSSLPRVVGQARLVTSRGPAGVVDSALRAVKALTKDGDRTFTGIGIGIPGLVDPVSGMVRHAVNLDLGAEGLDLADELRDRLALADTVPVVVENDVTAAARGVAAYLRLDSIDLAYLSVGTGLAAGILLAGRPWRGAYGAAGEIGHIPVDPAGPGCTCGQRGCLEVLASGTAIAARWPVATGESATALFAAAAAGDPRAVAVRDEVAAHLAVAVRLIALTVDVDRIVLGGGVAEVGEPLLASITDALRQQAAGSPFLLRLDLPGRLSLAPAGRPVAAIGAALLAHDHPRPPVGVVRG